MHYLKPRKTWFQKIKEVEGAKLKFVGLATRVFADMDNERIIKNIIGLTQDDVVKRFDATEVRVKEGDYIYLYMDTEDGDYCLSEGIVIRNPIKSKPYKFCCVLDDEIIYLSNYMKKFKNSNI